MSQENPLSTVKRRNKLAWSKRSVITIMGIGCLSLVVCIGFAGVFLLFSGVLSGPHGNRNDYPTWSPDGAHIVFQSDRNGNNDIYMMDADGSHITQLTRDPFATLYYLRSADDREPVFSPNGSRIALTSGRNNVMMNYIDTDIYVMNIDGSNIKQLTGVGYEEGGPAWSPNGKQIAYSSKDIYTSDGSLIKNPTYDIYVINVDGSYPIQLTKDRTNDLEVSWSPDGAHIVFISDRNGPDLDIYLMDADGSNVVQLTTDSANEFGPAWSPDNRHIAFNSDHNGNVQLYIMDADGSDVVQLTSDKSNSAYPSWSPDGSRIAFESDRNSGNANIYVMNADGSNIIPLTGK